MEPTTVMTATGIAPTAVITSTVPRVRPTDVPTATTEPYPVPGEPTAVVPPTEPTGEVPPTEPTGEAPYPAPEQPAPEQPYP
jgi:hypothetical protein